MTTVDVIIPLYNKRSTIERAIRSILEQTYQQWHLFIVNDGSTDDSLQAARQFTDSRITIIQQPNQGPGAARNAALFQADSEYVAFLDADDQWYPWYLANAVNAIRHSPVSFVGTFYEDWPQQTDMTAYWAKHNVYPGIYELDGRISLSDALQKIFFFHVGNTLVRTETAKKYGGFYDEEKCLLGEDTVFFAKLALNESFMIIEPAAVRHNRQDSALSNKTRRRLDIFLRKPRIILDYCRPEKKSYARRVIAWHACKAAHFRARAGRKKTAIRLTESFPEMKQFGFHYRRLCFEICLSRWFPYWIKMKSVLTTPIKKALKIKR